MKRAIVLLTVFLAGVLAAGAAWWAFSVKPGAVQTIREQANFHLSIFNMVDDEVAGTTGHKSIFEDTTSGPSTEGLGVRIMVDNRPVVDEKADIGCGQAPKIYHLRFSPGIHMVRVEVSGRGGGTPAFFECPAKGGEPVWADATFCLPDRSFNEQKTPRPKGETPILKYVISNTEMPIF
jgi:hypothetical protein